MRADPVDAARSLVADRFPSALQAWLGGSAARGQAKATSDLDITVVVPAAVVRRESLMWRGWPVELFVHTPASVRQFVAKDLAQRSPTMARLIAHGIALLDGDGGRDLARECGAVLAAGAGPVSEADVEMRRYALTDIRDDLVAEPAGPEGNAVAVAAWQQGVELLLANAGAWFGRGKWLVRQLAELDDEHGTSRVELLDSALRAALAGDRDPLIGHINDILEEAGGALWVGFTRAATLTAG